MSEIFNLADSNGEDYLDFGWEASLAQKEEESSSAKKGKGRKVVVAKKKGKSAQDSLNSIFEEGEIDRINMRMFEHGHPAPPVNEETYAIEDEPSGNKKKIPKGKVGKHQTLSMQLTSYNSHEKFHDAIVKSGLRIEKLDRMTVPELEELLARVQVVAINSTGQGNNMVHSGVILASGGLEKVMPARICNLNGFQQACQSDPELETLCAMASIDYGFASSMPLPVRMAMCLGTIGARVAGNNALVAKQQHLIAQLQSQLASQNAVPPPMQQQQQPPAAEISLSMPPPENYRGIVENTIAPTTVPRVFQDYN